MKRTLIRNDNTYIPSPTIRRVCLAYVDNEKVCHISKLSNDLREVVLETDEERRSAATAEVKN